MIDTGRCFLPFMENLLAQEGLETFIIDVQEINSRPVKR